MQQYFVWILLFFVSVFILQEVSIINVTVDIGLHV